MKCFQNRPKGGNARVSLSLFLPSLHHLIAPSPLSTHARARATHALTHRQHTRRARSGGRSHDYVAVCVGEDGSAPIPGPHVLLKQLRGQLIRSARQVSHVVPGPPATAQGQSSESVNQANQSTIGQSANHVNQSIGQAVGRVSPHTLHTPVSYTHLTLPTICSV